MADQYALNCIGPSLILKHSLPLLPKDRRAVFAALSARVGSIGDNRLGGWYAYRTAKAALNQMIRSASIEVSRSHNQAICVALHPGTVATDFTAKYLGRHPSVPPAEAAQNLLSVIDDLTPDQTGQFFDWQGKAVSHGEPPCSGPWRSAERGPVGPAPCRQRQRSDRHGRGDGRGHLCPPPPQENRAGPVGHAPFCGSSARAGLAGGLYQAGRSRRVEIHRRRIDAARQEHGTSTEVLATPPGEWRLIEALQNAPLTVTRLHDDRFIASLDAFNQWAAGRKELRMEYFYREMRRKTGLLMDGDAPAGGKWNFDHDNRKPRQARPVSRQPMQFDAGCDHAEVLDLVAHAVRR